MPIDGCKMGNRDLNIVCYADDAVLMADNEDDLQRLLYRVHLSCQKFENIVNSNHVLDYKHTFLLRCK